MEDKPLQKRWDRIAADWDIQVGDDGDRNRLLNSDAVLWRFAGEVKDRRVLDAGCGTGYLSRQLHAKGAKVTGVDFSPKMIDIARRKGPEIDFRVDSCATLATLENETFDLLVSNYVLMDLEDLEGAIQSFYRVLKPGGIAVLVFSHPCFPQGQATVDKKAGTMTYHWDFNYFEFSRQTDSPWGHFTSEFIRFHRPLSDYWKAFQKAGFSITDFEEPRIQPEQYQLAESEEELRENGFRPYSVAFRLEKSR